MALHFNFNGTVLVTGVLVLASWLADKPQMAFGLVALGFPLLLVTLSEVRRLLGLPSPTLFVHPWHWTKKNPWPAWG